MSFTDYCFIAFSPKLNLRQLLAVDCAQQLTAYSENDINTSMEIIELLRDTSLFQWQNVPNTSKLHNWLRLFAVEDPEKQDLSNFWTFSVMGNIETGETG